MTNCVRGRWSGERYSFRRAPSVRHRRTSRGSVRLDPFAVGAFVVSLALSVAFVVNIRRENERWEQHEREHVEGIHRIQNAAAREWALNLIDGNRGR